MAEQVNKAVKHGYGIVQIPKELRTYGDKTISADKLLAIISHKLMYPLASNSVIAKLAGCSYSYASQALCTPYAKSMLDRQIEANERLAKELIDGTGDSVTLWRMGINRAIEEYHKPNGDIPLITLGDRMSEKLTKASRLLGDHHTVHHTLADSQAYDDDDLELDPTLASILEDGEVESPPPPGDGVEGIIPDDTEKNN